MDAAEFAHAWSEPTLRFTAADPDAAGIPTSVRRFLEVAGLPREAAPMLNFAPEGVGIIREVPDPQVWGLPMTSGQYVQIGLAGAVGPICLDRAANHEVVILFKDDPAGRI